MGARISTGSDSKQDYRSPADFMEAVTKRFGPIAFDLAAHAGNKQSPNYFAPCTGPAGPLPLDKDAFGMDAFDHSWSLLSDSLFARKKEHGRHVRGLLWLNCEFNDIEAWARRCCREAGLGASILLLTPAAVGANWFRDLIAGHGDIYLLNGRLSFIPGRPTTRTACSRTSTRASTIAMRSWGPRWRPRSSSASGTGATISSAQDG